MSPSNKELLASLTALIERYKSDSILSLRNGNEIVDIIEWANHTKGIVDLLMDHTMLLTRALIEERS